VFPSGDTLTGAFCFWDIMPVQGYNREKCEQRNRVAARRDGCDAFSFRFLREAPAEAQEAGLLYAHGSLPKTENEALDRINSRLDTPLHPDALYLRYMEAASGAFIPDRFMFLDGSTLRNIANDGRTGAAFMNSHRDGSMSAPAELPMGRTFSGRYEEYRDGSRRALLGVYMLRGVQPNGASGPSTDDLYRMIEGGQVSDVSVGLYGGERVCDVCGKELYSYDRESGEYICKHAPGTSRKMTDEQREAQKGRGVPDGLASYSLVNAHLSEVSAVFDGAVPGAGFRKALALSRGGFFSPAEAAQAKKAYATLLSRGDFDMDEEQVEGILARVLKRMGFGGSSSPGYQPETRPGPQEGPPALPGETDREKALREQLAKAEKDREEGNDRHRKELLELDRANAERFAASVADRRFPYEGEEVTQLHAYLASQHRKEPIKLKSHTGEEVSPVVLFEGVVGGAQPHRMTQNLFPAGLPEGASILQGFAESRKAADRETDDLVAAIRAEGKNGKGGGG
jgi:hypothetical protein